MAAPQFADDLARRVLRGLDEQLETLRVQVAGGAPADWTQYREMVGRIRGLEQARALLLAPFGSDDPLS